MRALGPTGTQMRGMRWLAAANPCQHCQSPRFGGVSKNGSSKFTFEATKPAKQTLKDTTRDYLNNFEMIEKEGLESLNGWRKSKIS